MGQEKLISGFNIKEKEFKFVQYAVDFFKITNPLYSLPVLLRTLDIYKKLAGYKINQFVRNDASISTRKSEGGIEYITHKHVGRQKGLDTWVLSTQQRSLI